MSATLSVILLFLRLSFGMRDKDHLLAPYKQFALYMAALLIDVIEMLDYSGLRKADFAALGIDSYPKEVTICDSPREIDVRVVPTSNHPVKSQVGSPLCFGLSILRNFLLKISIVWLNLQIFVYLRHIDIQLKFIYSFSSLNPEKTENHIAFEVAICYFVQGWLFFYLEADDLLVSFLLPVGVVAEYLLFEGGNVMVEQRCEIVDLFEERH